MLYEYVFGYEVCYRSRTWGFSAGMFVSSLGGGEDWITIGMSQSSYEGEE